ncbi:UPF0686 protein C11orf1, partial [Balearica regulorum gibbericeps]
NSLHGSLMHATDHGELRMDWNSTSEFSQYGWRCTTNENDYSLKTLMGSWNEERYHIQTIVHPKPFPSQLSMLNVSFSFQYTHCFETTYSSDYKGIKNTSENKKYVHRKPHWFLGHYSELEAPSFNPTAQFCSTLDYRPP